MSDDFDYWRLCEELTVLEAALLVAGVSPTLWWEIEKAPVDERPLGYEPAKAAIIGALRNQTVEGKIIPEQEVDDFRRVVDVEGTIGARSRVNVESLKAWLASRGLRNGFFFPTHSDVPNYLDPQDARYAPKLAAAVRAWQAVIDPAGKHPKQALSKWLREHAFEFGLSDEEGKPNETGIEEIAKVANWQPVGGAPKTPNN